MGVKVPGTKCSFWCERKIRGTNGTKREKYGEKYSGVNAPTGFFSCRLQGEFLFISCFFTHMLCAVQVSSEC